MFSTHDPVTGLLKARYEHCSASELETAIASLDRAFHSWKHETTGFRKTVLLKILQNMQREKENLARLITEEMGKPLQESLTEVNKCISTLERVQELSLDWAGEYEASGAGYGKSKIKKEPLGVIYAAMPWNHPMWQVVRMFIPALLAGNTVLLKHSELTPLLGAAIQALFNDVYTEPILLNLYVEHGFTDRILGDGRVGGVSLTGSVDAGRAVYSLAAKHLKKCVLELGGSDPYVVCADANLDVAAKKIAQSRLNNTGQTCIAAKRALVHRSVLDAFLEKLKIQFDSYTLGPLAHPKFKLALQGQLENFKKHCSPELIYRKPHGQSESSAFVDAEIYLLKQNSPWLKDQEFFGPVLVVIPFENENEAVQIANSTDFALGAGVFSENIAGAEKLAEKIRAGQIAINDYIRTDLNLPFGGFKNSGLGRELGREGFFEFTQAKVVSLP